MLERMIEMKLKEFIQTVIAPNTIVRLWKPLNQEKPYGGYICLTEKEQMNWEILKIPKLCECEALFVTDIISVMESSPEAVNIIIQTDMTANDVKNMIEEFKIAYRKSKMNACESKN